MTDGSGTTTYKYDALGRVTEKAAPNFGKVTYTYDLISSMDEGYHYELQTDSTGVTRTVYDRQNRIVSVSTSTGERTDVAEISYYDNGAREKVTYADGSSEYYTFYGNNLVKGVTNKLADGTVIDQFSYVYDGAGNLKSKIELANGVMRGETTYTYDKQNRLVSVTNPDGSTTSYTYDKAGNRATETTVENGVETVKSYIYNGRNQLLTVEQTVGGVVASKTTYTYDANGNQLTEMKTENGTTVTVLANEYDLRNQLICSVTEDAVINNTYNASGYRVEKTVSKNGTTEKTYFLYDGNNVIMESDGNKVTAKNTYGGPLLLRTVFGDIETTYQYLYNAHGDVVTLLFDGAVVATYYYDSFGNILEQTGNVDNSILYAGYQYDEETGLYYINARMYDPVTARFLQADTYLGNTSDPLSLNLYTYCLNNPHKYTDPSGHFAIVITAGVVIGAAIWGLVGAGIEYKMQKDAGGIIDYNHVIFQGTLNAAIALISGGTANGMMAAQQGARMTARTFGRMMLMEAGFGVAEGIIGETGYQLINGTKIKDLDVGHIAVSGVMGGASGVGGALAGEAFGAGLKMLKNTRVVSKAVSGTKGQITKYANILKGKNTSGFKYKHNPSDNPEVLKHAIEDASAVYGYSPRSDSARIGKFANGVDPNTDWGNPVKVAEYRRRRIEYHANNDDIPELVIKMKSQGYSIEDIARAANYQRNMNRLNDYVVSGDMKGLQVAKKSNLLLYNNEFGLTAEDAFAKYGSWEEVIKASTRTNPGMDACCGLYDTYYHLYGIE